MSKGASETAEMPANLHAAAASAAPLAAQPRIATANDRGAAAGNRATRPRTHGQRELARYMAERQAGRNRCRATCTQMRNRCCEAVAVVVGLRRHRRKSSQHDQFLLLQHAG